MVSLKDYLSFSHEEQEYQQLFLGLNESLHALYRGKSYVPSFDPRNSVYLSQVLDQVAVQSDMPRRVSYLATEAISDMYLEDAKRQNVLFLTQLMATVYIAGASMGFDPARGLFHASILEQNFDECSYSFPAEDVDYFKQVILEKNYIFYDDYLRSKQQRTGANQQSRQYVKSNGISVLEDDLSVDNSYVNVGRESGYSRVIFLASTFMATLLLLGFIIASIIVS